MPFEKGNQHGKKSKARKPFADALKIALAEDGPKGQKKLRVVADNLVQQAVDGEPWAIKEVMDRVDGKPAQQINHADADGEGPAQFVYKLTYETQPD